MKNVLNVLNKTDSSISVEEGFFHSFNPHSHTYYEMTLYEENIGYIEINEQNIPLDTTTAILIAPTYFHEGFAGKKKGKYIKLGFNGNILPENFSVKNPIILKHIEKDCFFLKLYREIAINNENEEYKKSLLLAAVCFIIQNGKKIFSSGENGIGFKAVNIINENFNTHLTLSSVAKELYITPQYLSNVFKSEIHLTFSRYLTLVRLRNAKKLLKETSENITDICEICGYGNLSHFIRSFKAEYGVSPSAYRKNIK